MSVNISLLDGAVDVKSEWTEEELEALLLGFLKALMEEQKGRS